MDILNILVVLLLLIVSIVSALAFIYFYIIDRRSMLCDFNFYILFFSLFYIAMPALLTLYFDTSLVGANSDQILLASLSGLYFHAVFLLFFLIRPVVSIFDFNRFHRYRSRSYVFMMNLMATLIFIYVIFVILGNYQVAASYGTNRGLLSRFLIELESVYKIKALFVILFSISFYLFLYSKSFKVFIYLAPYLVLDLIFLDRSYTFGILVVGVFSLVLTNRLPKTSVLLLLPIIVASMAVFRANVEFQIANVLFVLNEFFNTWSTVHLTIMSIREHDLIDAGIFSLFRAFPSVVYTSIFGAYESYAVIPAEIKTTKYGLAGSIVAEALAFRNPYFFFLMPVLIGLYGKILTFLLRTRSYTGALLFLISLVYLQQIFRYSFFEIALYPFYVVFWLLPFMWMLDSIYFGRGNINAKSG